MKCSTVCLLACLLSSISLAQPQPTRLTTGTADKFAVPVHQIQYTLEVLPRLVVGGITVPAAMNDGGVIVGEAEALPDLRHAATWEKIGGNYVITDLDLGGLAGSRAFGVNNAGIIAGVVNDQYGFPFPVCWDEAGQVANLPLPPGAYGEARGINTDNMVVGGFVTPPNFTPQACLWMWSGEGEEWVFTPIPIPTGVLSTWGHAINRHGQVTGVGEREDPDEQVREFAFTYNSTTGEFVALSSVGEWAKGRAINGRGDVAGYMMGQDFVPHATVWSSAGNATDIHTFPAELGWASEAFDIAGNGEVVGLLWTGEYRAFWYSPNTGMRDLNDLIVSCPGQPPVSQALVIRGSNILGINATGQAVILTRKPAP